MSLARKTVYGLVCFIIIAVMLWAMRSCIRVPSPRYKKLLECSDVYNKAYFQCPKGHNYRFGFGIPQGGEHKISFAGKLTIYRKGEQIHVVNFDSDKVWKGNWLDREGLDAYIFGSTIDSFVSFDLYLKENEGYEVVIEFKKIPPHGTSLWLHYITVLTAT